MSCSTDSPRTGGRWIRAAETPVWSAGGQVVFTRSTLIGKSGTITDTVLRFNGVVDVLGADAVGTPGHLFPRIVGQYTDNAADGVPIVNATGHALAELVDVELPLGNAFFGTTALAAGAGQSIECRWPISWVLPFGGVDGLIGDPLEAGLNVENYAAGGETTIQCCPAILGEAATDRATVISGTFQLWHYVVPRVAAGYRSPQILSVPLVTSSTTLPAIVGQIRRATISVGAVGICSSAAGVLWALARSVLAPDLGLGFEITLRETIAEELLHGVVGPRTNRITNRNSFPLAQAAVAFQRPGDAAVINGLTYQLDAAWPLTLADQPAVIVHLYGRPSQIGAGESACGPARQVVLPSVPTPIAPAGSVSMAGSGLNPQTVALLTSVLPTAA